MIFRMQSVAPICILEMKDQLTKLQHYIVEQIHRMVPAIGILNWVRGGFN